MGEISSNPGIAFTSTTTASEKTTGTNVMHHPHTHNSTGSKHPVRFPAYWTSPCPRNILRTPWSSTLPNYTVPQTPA